MTERLAPVDIPDKSSFKPAEVCELLQIPTYVLRTWENEFKDLGVAKSPGAPRAYRRIDVELAFRIKELVFNEHLTLAGVRRRLEQEGVLKGPDDDEATAAPTALAAPVRERIAQVKGELRSLLVSLSGGHASTARAAATNTVSDAAPGEVSAPSAQSEQDAALSPKGQGRGRKAPGGASLLPGFDRSEAQQENAAPHDATSETEPAHDETATAKPRSSGAGGKRRASRAH